MAEETTPTPEADETKPEAAAEEASQEKPEGTGEESLEEAPEPAAEAAEGETEDAGDETPAPAAAAPAAEEKEEAEEEVEPAYPSWSFKAGLCLTLLAIGGILYVYVQKFLPKLEEAAILKLEHDNAHKGNATAQLELAKKYKDSYDKSVVSGTPARPMLIQAYAWVGLATREYLEVEDQSHGAGHKDDHGAGHKDDHGAGHKDDHGAGHKDDHGAGHKDDHGAGHKDDHGAGHDAGHKAGSTTAAPDSMSAQKALDAGKFKEAILLFKNELDSENRKVHPNKTKVAEFNNGLNVSRSKHGMEFIALAKAKGVLRNDKRESLMLAYKWFSLMDADHQDANATKQKVYAEGVLKNEFGSDFLTQSNSIVDATLLIAEWKNDESLLLDPDEQKAVDLLTKAHVAQFAPAHGHGDAHGKGREVHWTYSGDTGPEHWGKSFPVALHGTAQSPINIETQDVKEASFLEAVHFNYNPNSMFEVRNNGHTLHVNVTTPKGEAVNLMTIGTNHFKLLQFHFHAKSEHMVNGRHSPMELHLVHELVKLDGEGKVIAEKAAHPVVQPDVQPDAHGKEAGHDDGHAAAHAAPKETKKLAVIGVMIEQLNEDNTEHSHKNFIRKVWQVLPKVDEKTAEASTGVLLFDMHPGELLPPEGKRSYYRYQGSLTTPPCTEGVTWTILQEPVYYDKKQIEAFEDMKFFSEIGQKNNRPVQPLNARYVLRYQDAQRSTSTTSAPSVGSHTKPATLIPSADPHWDHQLKGKSGQDNWHKLKSEWSIAATGRRQSPINIATARAVNVLKVDPTLMRPLQVYYNSSPITVINNGHTIKAIFNKDDKNSMTLGGERYRLLQFHFHYRSEHKIDDRDYAMELHLVHEQVADPSKLAVIGVMIDEGAENTHVKGFWEHLPKPAGHGEVVRGDSYNFNPVTLIPNGGDYFQYQGSLTTPPCSENVYWTVMQKPITFSKEQIEAFSKMFPKNNRDVQSPFVRQILRYNFSRN